MEVDGGVNWEIVIVDNGSTDSTKIVVDEWTRNLPIRYVMEGRAGLSVARNAGVRNGRGRIFAFTDDDVRVSKNWVNEIITIFGLQESITLIGGKVLLGDRRLQRISIMESNERAVYRYPNDGAVVMGANFAVRAVCFSECGGFDERLGAGRFLSGCEEIEFVYKVIRSGHSVAYEPTVVVSHYHDRFTIKQAAALEYSYAKGTAAYLIKHALLRDQYAIKLLYWMALSLPRRFMEMFCNDPGLSLRKRAHLRGLMVGLVTAPVIMSKDPPS
jgi:glycosyltransferase involved in cell wall biosynthesis